MANDNTLTLRQTKPRCHPGRRRAQLLRGQPSPRRASRTQWGFVAASPQGQGPPSVSFHGVRKPLHVRQPLRVLGHSFRRGHVDRHSLGLRPYP
jgi:hypothetical protein